MKTTRHSLLAKGLMVLLSLLVMIFALTYSWFADNPRAETSGISATVVPTGDFQYAIGFCNSDTNYSYLVTEFTNQSTRLNLEKLKLHASDTRTYNLLKDFTPIDVTGDGCTLIRPSMSYGNKEINESSLDFSIAEPNVQYISFDLYFRSTIPDVPIKLGVGSWAKGECEINNHSYTGANADNKSTYGDFSKDAIVGAVRVAFIPYNNLPSGNFTYTEANYLADTSNYLSKSAKIIWNPRPELKLTDSGSTTGWTLSTDGTETDHKYYNIFECKPYLTTGWDANTDSANYHKTVTYPSEKSPTPTASVITTNTLTTGGSQEFCRISNTVKIGDYYYTKANVRIWIEGTDHEARRAVSGGKFEVNFKITTN